MGPGSVPFCNILDSWLVEDGWTNLAPSISSSNEFFLVPRRDLQLGAKNTGDASPRGESLANSTPQDADRPILMWNLRFQKGRNIKPERWCWAGKIDFFGVEYFERFAPYERSVKTLRPTPFSSGHLDFDPSYGDDSHIHQNCVDVCSMHCEILFTFVAKAFQVWMWVYDSWSTWTSWAVSAQAFVHLTQPYIFAWDCWMLV